MAKNMPLIIHIGYHKTGSTALQAWLESCRSELESHGVIYPAGLSNWKGHPELAWWAADNRYGWQDRFYGEAEVNEFYRPLLDESRDPEKTVLLSSEELCRLDFDLDGLIVLREFLAEYRPIIMGYFRDPLDFLLSRFRHEVQHGSELRPLRTYLANFDNLMSANFYSRTMRWQQCFDNRCVFRKYPDFITDGTIEFNFGNLLGLDHDFIKELIRKSPSYRQDEIQLHPALIDSVRMLVKSDLSKQDKEAMFGKLFEMSQALPRRTTMEYLTEIGLPDDIITMLNSLRTSDIDTKTTVQSILAGGD